MENTFLFYDLETTGTNPARDRIMQFAAQRTTMDLKEVDEPINVKVRLDDDVIPSPGAVMITGQTPQSVQDGMSELELARFTQEKVFTPGTIVVGYNNVSFDDNFMRYMYWRNFYDPYEWAWRDGRSRWDMCYVARMVRAIRPEGIVWPDDDDGYPCNKLEDLAKANNILHQQAHDGLSDVVALIGLARLIKEHQPRMFDYLLAMRDKNKVMEIVNLQRPKPFVYTTTRYGHKYNYTSVACPIAEGNTNNAILTYNLRYDPTPWLGFSAKEIAELRFTSNEELESKNLSPFPITTLTTNQCPAIAPTTVLNGNDGWSRLGLNPDTIQRNMSTLQKNPEFIDQIKEAYQSEPFPSQDLDVEQRMYEGFLNDADRQTISNIRQADAAKLATWSPYFHDERLPDLLVHYKARNYPDTLSQPELEIWKDYREQKIANQEEQFQEEMQKFRQIADNDQNQLLNQLQKWHDQVVSKNS